MGGIPLPGVIEAITFLVIAAQAGALPAGLAAVFGTTGFLSTVISAGLSVLSSLLFRPKQPKPEDGQVSIRQGTTPRSRYYGRVKISGPWVFGEAKEGTFHKVIALQTGELDAIEEFWVDDNLVTVDGSGFVETEPYYDDGGQKLKIQYRLGLSIETYYSDLGTFPEWDEDHLGNGVASLYATQRAVNSEKLTDMFPKVAETLYRVVTRASKVISLSPDSPPDSPAALEWSENAAEIIRDYMIHQDGMRLPLSLFTTTQAQAGWQVAYQKCAEAVALKAGGTEQRYRLWGGYTFDERPADVLGRMLVCCDGRIIPTPDGGITLEIGDWEEPTVIIDADTITGFSDVKRGRDILTTANTIKATFLSPQHDYQATDADPWVDDADVLIRGEISQDTPFNMAPSHGQARRLMKLAAYRANPNWIGTFQCNLKALAAFGKRFVRITYPLFEIDEVFEIEDFRFVIGEGNILIGVTLQVHSMPEEAYEWDAATEEGTAPLAEEVTVDRTIPLPGNFTFTENIITVSGVNVSVGVISFDPPPVESLTVEGRYKKTSDTAWLVIPIGEDETEGQTAALEDGVEYEAQVRHVTITGRVGNWTASETITPISNPNAPQNLISVSAVGGMGNAVLTVTSQADPLLSKINIYRVAAGGVLDKNSDPLVTTGALPGLTFTAHIGDTTTTNMLVNGDGGGSSPPTLNAGWTNTPTGKFSHSATTGSFLLWPSLTITAAGVYRLGLTIDAIGGSGVITPRNSGSVNENWGTTYTTTGVKKQSLTAVNSNTAFGLGINTNGTVQLDDVKLFLQTASSVPQGDYDLYVFAVNASGIESASAVVATNVSVI